MWPESLISILPSYHIATFTFTHGQARGTLPFGLLENAIKIDPMFQMPRIWLANGYYNTGEFAETDDLISEINQNREQLSPLERLATDRLSAQLQGKPDEALQISRQELNLAPSNIVVRFINASQAEGRNRP